MSGSNNNRGGWWGRPSSGPRIGRVGQWGGSDSSSSAAGGSGGRRIATLGDLGGGSGGGPPMGGPGGFGAGGGDDDSDDEQRPPEGESWYAGGERSGISVQNPDRPGGPGGQGANVPGGEVVRDLLRRAAEGGVAPSAGSSAADAAEAADGRRWGTGHTLGGEDVESTVVPDPHAPPPRAEGDHEPAVRHITFWREGFSVEDGELMRYDNPEHARILNEINGGRAPPAILNVLPGQPVELRVARRLNEDYVEPPKKAFSGGGNRLGGVVPDIAGAGASSSSGSASTTMPGEMDVLGDQPPSGVATAAPSASFSVDQSQPTTSVQVRLADGTRLVARMNLTHTVGDIRNFIEAARAENRTRAYTVGTTFPNKTLVDYSQTIEAAGLKNAVIVQRWV